MVSLLEKAEALKDYIVSIRRDVHANPELGYQEYETAALITAELQALPLTIQRGVAKTGVIAELRKGEGKSIGIRADIDALPILEKTGLPFSSKNDGVMHACGHDAHTAMALGAVKLLSNEDFKGSVRFIFQPAEENNYNDPDGWSGGKRMVKEGVLDGLDAIIGLHQIPTQPSHTISISNGPILAAADFFKITVVGKASHAGASPHLGIDAVYAASSLVQNLQQVVARNTSPNETAVLSIGSIHGGEAPNIIADKVEMLGTLRSLNDQTHQHIKERIEDICKGVALATKADITFEVTHQVPVTSNSFEISEISRKAASRLLKEEQILQLPPIMAGEDFGYMAQTIPATFALIGTQRKDQEAFTLHHPKMDLDESVLPLGSAFLAQTAIDFLKQ